MASIIVADLTCRTPQYDRRLIEALHRVGVEAEMWAAGCHSSVLYKSKVDVTPGGLDIAAHLPCQNEQVTKGLKSAEYLVNLSVLTWKIVRDSIDLLHLQWLPFLEVSAAELGVIDFIQRQGTSVVYTVHNVLPHDSGGEDTRRRFEKVYQKVDALVCHTQASRRRLIDEFEVAPSKIWHIPHGPLQPLYGDSEGNVPVGEVVDVDPAEPLVVLFGILRPYKGYDFLLRAWPQVQRHVEAAQLAIVGRANESVQQDIESLVADLGVDASVARVYRYVSEEELHSVIQAADILVYPYRDITQSGALFTGMSAGKAIVATNVGGFTETLRDGETGRIVEFGDTEQLAATLTDLLTDPSLRAKMGRAVKRDLQERFSWEKIAEQTQECYQSVLASNSVRT